MCHIYLRHLVVNKLEKLTLLGIEPGTVVVLPENRNKIPNFCHIYILSVIERKKHLKFRTIILSLWYVSKPFFYSKSVHLNIYTKGANIFFL